MKTYKEMTRQELIEKCKAWKKKYFDNPTVYQTKSGNAGLMWSVQQRLPQDMIWEYSVNYGEKEYAN